ncbi:hypothetical protein [Alicyclobacillus sp. SO9]|uniref:hypothetical protein n=1 Tax=Alicyclobacillus sp. SO9 TaxID=2665646 RepID=UPI0018E752D7|nr:hypothetical protein [Alicyclobacillus sp. SO9]QQE80299.1 hypothetical protein GI364_07700 [Alicyclobacillus sp. SO9]
MSKRTHHNRAASAENDKPDYAADYPVQKAKAEKKEDDKAHVQEHLQGSVLEELSRLKSKLEKEAASADTKGEKLQRGSPSLRQDKRAGSSKQVRETPDEKKSFAELFEPQEEEDVSFEDILKESKLDWRKFK